MIKEWSDRSHAWLAAQFGGLELIRLLLVWFTLGSASLGLTALTAELPSGFLLTLATASLLGAWMLTGTRLSGRKYGLTGTLLGLLSLALTTGKLGRPLLALLTSLIPTAGGWFRGGVFDFAPAAAAWQALVESLAALLARFGNWLQTLQSPNPLTDPLVISLLYGMALWLATLWAVWWARRRNSALPGLLPAIAMLAGFVFYDGSRRGIVWLVLAGGGILLLQAVASYKQSLQRWERQRLDRVEIEPALILSVTVLTIGMMLAGGLLPSISLEKVGRAIDRLFQSEQEAGRGSGAQTVSGLPNPAAPHILGPGPDASPEIVMFVSVDGYHPPPPVTEAYERLFRQAVPYRWQSQTYDRYTGHGWFAETARVEEMAAGQIALPNIDLNALPGDFTLVTQHVTRLQRGEGTAFSAGELLRIDQPYRVLWRSSGDIIAIQVDADTYTATSRLPSVSVAQLRAAGEDYPESLERYLQLPDGLPMRVRDLALSLTVGQPTAFDKAAVLEAYLRQFPYSLEVPGPPSGRDAVDYFLFDLKTGYCDYFASAMVVMARSTGLPARLVMGYTSGFYDDVEGRFVVRAANAHAWAEAYFPGIGWVEFEPTPSQPLPLRAGQEPESSAPLSLPPPGQQAPFQFYFQRVWSRGLLQTLLGIAVAALIGLFLPLETWALSLLPTERAFQAIFRRLYRRGRRFGLPPDPSRTPDEFTRLLAASLEWCAGNTKRAALVADMNSLTGLYNRLLFSEYQTGKNEKKEAIRAWARLRRGLRQARG